MNTWKRIGVSVSHEGVMGLHNAHEVDQNGPIYTKMVTIVWQSKVFRICPEWHIWSITGLNGNFIGKEVRASANGANLCSSCTATWLLPDLSWLLPPFKCPFNPEMYHNNHSGQIRNTLLSLAMVTILVDSGALWCVLVHLMCDPMTPPWLALTPILFQVFILSKNGLY